MNKCVSIVLCPFFAELNSQPLYIFLSCPVYQCTTQHSGISSEILGEEDCPLFSCALLCVSPDSEPYKSWKLLSGFLSNLTEVWVLPSVRDTIQHVDILFPHTSYNSGEVTHLEPACQCFILSVPQKEGSVEVLNPVEWNTGFQPQRLQLFFPGELWNRRYVTLTVFYYSFQDSLTALLDPMMQSSLTYPTQETNNL